MRSVPPGEPGRGGPRLGSAFLLAQLGAHAAQQYAERISHLGLAPPHTGVLFAIARKPGRSQLALATDLGTPPTRLVALLDALEERGAIERRRNPDDRRNNAIYLTDAGRRLMADLAATAARHEREITAGLGEAERQQLHALLSRIADQQGLRPGVHPGYAKRDETTR